MACIECGATLLRHSEFCSQYAGERNSERRIAELEAALAVERKAREKAERNLAYETALAYEEEARANNAELHYRKTQDELLMFVEKALIETQ